MKIKELTQYLETIAPASYQESYDNAGLIVGNPDTHITGVMICLDSTEAVISCLLYTSPSPRDATLSRMPSSA